MKRRKRPPELERMRLSGVAVERAYEDLVCELRAKTEAARKAIEAYELRTKPEGGNA